MLRVAAALLLLASMVPATASAECDATGQVCWSEERTGGCPAGGTGMSEARARNVMLGFPVTAGWRAHSACAPGTSSQNMTVDGAAGGYAKTRAYWESRSDGWRWIRVDVEAPMTDFEYHWFGSDANECTLHAFGTLLSASVNDMRSCPTRPPSQPAIRWGNHLP